MLSATNAPESANLSPSDQQIFEAGRAACASLSKTFELWVTVARAVELARAKADRIGTRQAFERILNQQGIAPSLGSNWDSQKATASKLLKILERLPEVEAWRASLTSAQRIDWAAPTTVHKHCPVFATDRPERGDAAGLAAIDRIAPEKSGIDWSPKDPAELRRSLSEAAAVNQRLAIEARAFRAEAAELKARLDSHQLIEAGVSVKPVAGDDPYLAALQSEIAELKAENAKLLDRLRALEAMTVQPATFLDAAALALTLGTQGIQWPQLSEYSSNKRGKLLRALQTTLSDLDTLHRSAAKKPAK